MLTTVLLYFNDCFCAVGRQFECDHGFHRGSGADSGICVPYTAPEQVPRGMADPEAGGGYGNK